MSARGQANQGNSEKRSRVSDSVSHTAPLTSSLCDFTRRETYDFITHSDVFLHFLNSCKLYGLICCGRFQGGDLTDCLIKEQGGDWGAEWCGVQLRIVTHDYDLISSTNFRILIYNN